MWAGKYIRRRRKICIHRSPSTFFYEISQLYLGGECSFLFSFIQVCRRRGRRWRWWWKRRRKERRNELRVERRKEIPRKGGESDWQEKGEKVKRKRERRLIKGGMRKRKKS